jgi:succinate dehydrogenase / fumarate reductase cytochrome b subunit
MNNFLNSSLGRKVVMAATGLFLCLFLVEHLYGNLLLYYGDGGAAFNEYSHDAVHSILIRTIEVVLFVAIVLHVLQAVALTRQNAKARPVKYAVMRVNETSSWFSRNMGITGAIIFFFLVVHLKHFFWSYRITGLPLGETVAQEVAEAFTNPWYSLLYIVSVLFLAFHLNHGFQSAFQTVGLNNKKYARVWKMAGTGFAVLMAVGFGSFPVIFYLGQKAGWDVLNWAI